MCNRLIMLAGLYIMLSANLAFAQTVVETTTKSNSDITTSGKTIVISPPPSAITPSVNSSSSDLCTVGVAGAVQTQILGISTGETYRDQNCERLKISKTLYDMGMKVAAVSVMCQDERVFDAMLNAGTPCPKDGLVGDKARIAWEMEAVKEQIEREQNNPMRKMFNENIETKTGLGVVISTLAFLLFL